MKNLRDRVAVITGAANGIGLDLAVRFLEEGMDVVIADKVADDLAHAEETLRPLGNVIAVETDVSDRESVQRLADASVDRFGAQAGSSTVEIAQLVIDAMAHPEDTYFPALSTGFSNDS